MSSPIQAINLREIRLPLRQPFVASHGEVTDRRILLLELCDADGYSAWSECVAMAEPSYFPDTADTAWLAIREWIAPRVLGWFFEHPQDVAPRINQGVRGHAMARAAIEMGCWGLDAARQGLSLAQLLGGTEGTRRTVETGAALGLQPSLEVLTERVEQLARAGYRRIKLKIGPGADLEPLRAARAALSKAHSKTNDPNGRRVGLMADANSAYTLADVEHLARFDALDLMMIEQPLAWDDLRHHAELQRRLSTPICLDESLTHCARVDDMLHFGSGRIVNLKPGRVGGLAESLAIHDLCRRHDVPLWCGGMLESGIGRAYNVALASLPGFNLPGDLSPSAHYWERDIVEPEWTMDARGRIAVPRGTAGLGVAVDVDRIDDLTVRQETLTAARAAQTSR